MMVSNLTRLSRLWLKRTGLVPVKRTTMTHPHIGGIRASEGCGTVGACRALAGPSRPGATLQNPARLHRGTCRADCFSQPPRVGVVHERGGDGRSNGQRGKAARARLPDREGMEQVPVSRPFCFSCALCLDAGRVSEVSSTPHG